MAEPKISAALNGPERVDIPADEAPDPEGDASAEAEVTETPTPTPTEAPDQEITLEDYENLYKEMLAVAEIPKHALVTVIVSRIRWITLIRIMKISSRSQD